jgi:hypothetical protein
MVGGVVASRNVASHKGSTGASGGEKSGRYRGDGSSCSSCSSRRLQVRVGTGLPQRMSHARQQLPLPQQMLQQMQQRMQQPQRRRLSFSYAGPRSLREILKVDLLRGMEASEISDLWLSHHEAKVRAGVRPGVRADLVHLLSLLLPCAIPSPFANPVKRNNKLPAVVAAGRALAARGNRILLCCCCCCRRRRHCFTTVAAHNACFSFSDPLLTTTTMLSNGAKLILRRSAWWACASRATRGPRCWSGPRSGTWCDCRCCTDSTLG